jgi:hypothetical protein
LSPFPSLAALTLPPAMQVTVARCRPLDVVDAVGSFRATLLVRATLHRPHTLRTSSRASLSAHALQARTFDDDTWRVLLHGASPPFEMLTVRLLAV